MFNKFVNKTKELKNRKKTSKIRYIFLIYFLIILFSSLILFFPWVRKVTPENWWNYSNYIDSLFTLVSAFSDTGLVTLETQATWNMFGQAIIAILIFVGGTGFFALKIFILNYLFRKKFYNVDKELLLAERGDVKNQTSNLVISSLKFIISTLVISGFILTIYFYLAMPTPPLGEKMEVILPQSPQGNWSLSFRFGFFHAISALNNAGFDIMGGKSLMPYYGNFWLQFIIVILFIIGGIGYPVIYDINSWIKFKIKYRNERKYHWSLITKISVTTYFILSIFALAVIIPIEVFSKNPTSFWNHMIAGKYKYGAPLQKIWTVLFTVFSTRSAGFATIDLNSFSSSTLIIMTILMFIGAAPASTGGGIRTTTFAIIFVALISRISGSKTTRMFRRKINSDKVVMASNVFIISITLLMLGTIILNTSVQNYSGNLSNNTNSLTMLFETSSAFGTAGLSLGITPNLNLGSKFILIFIMFIGQFGISSTIIVWRDKISHSNTYEYIEEDVLIG